MMIQITLNDIDITDAGNDLVAIDGMLEEFICLPTVKQPYSNNWGDTNSVEVDISTPFSLYQREVTFKLFVRTQNARDILFGSINQNPSNIRVQINQFRYPIRLLSYDIDSIDGGRCVITIRVSIDNQEDFDLRDKEILGINSLEELSSRFGIQFLETSDDTTTSIELKPYTEVNAKNRNGVIILPRRQYNHSHKSKSVELYIRTTDLNMFRQLFQTLQYYFINKGRFLFQNRYYVYSESKTKQLIEQDNSIFWSFEVSLSPA